MRITAVETFPVSVPLAKPVHMSHVTITRSNNVLVRISTDEGLVGWGEGVEAMDLTGENQGRIKAAVDHIGQRLIGQDPLRRHALWQLMQQRVLGNRTAIGALDIAIHDLAGKALGVPVADLIGGATRTEIPTLTLFGSGVTGADVETFIARYEAGYRWFKLKLGIGAPQVEIDTFAHVARDDVVMSGDANAAWNEQQAARFLRGLDGMAVRFIEQPVRDPGTLIRLAAASPVPLCADESAGSLEEIASFGPTPVAGVSLKLIKLGGITGVMRGAALCQQLGLSINLAGKIAETSIAAAANVHCAAAIGETAFGTSPGNQGIAMDVTDRPVAVVDGTIALPSGPGLGIDVNEEKVRAMAS